MRTAQLPLLALLVFGTPIASPAQTVGALPGWAADHQAVAAPAFLAACRTAGSLPADRNGVAAAPRPDGWAEACAEVALLPPADDTAFRALLTRRFLVQPAAQGLLTGYYEPELQGSLTRSELFNVPLRGRPADLVDTDPATAPPEMRGRRAGRMVDGRLQPYFGRAAIEAGEVAEAATPVIWLADATEKFFLQIQGSGRVVLPDKRVIRVNYAGQNGQPYVAIGRVLIERGEMSREQVTMQSIREWLAAAPPERATELRNSNPSYVFFRRTDELRPKDGPIGTLGVPLTPGRSIAVDRTQVPLGALVWIVSRDPVTGQPLQRLTVALDTGGAIRGPGRGDLFYGWGAEAGDRAGRMRETVDMYVLLPRPPEPRPPEPLATATATVD